MSEIVIETLSPWENMRRDDLALLQIEEGSEKPKYRLYRWDRVCLSLGYFQESNIDLAIPVVKRPTGGGALLHGWDISFSIADFKDRWGGTPSKVYANVSRLFLEIFIDLGVEVSVERFRGRYRDRFYCFWVPTLGEITHKGKKVLSMAMRTGRRGFLIHGSVYETFDYEEASRILDVEERLLRDRVVSLADIGIDNRDFASALTLTMKDLAERAYTHSL